MSSPEESFEVAVDGGREAEERTQAIEALARANECGRLSELARRDGLDPEFRERAVAALAEPQCKTTLESVVEEGKLPDGLHEKAETWLGQTPDHTGAGP